jgi:hypothetical protein
MLMSNPLFQALGGNQQPNMMGQFQQFVQQMQGKNARDEINILLRTGKISQQQLNNAQQAAQQMMNMLGKMKK